MKYVHHLVLEAFVGPCPQGMECRHLDGDPANNKLENLKWGTKQENAADQTRHGTRMQKGETHTRAKLTAKDVIAIRQSFAENVTMNNIAEKYEVTSATISAVITRRTWKDA